MTTLQPLADRVLILLDDEPVEKVSKGGIILPQVHKERPQMGEVLAHGDEVDEVVSGDRVLFGKYAGTDLTLNEKKVAIIRVGDILATVVEEDDEDAPAISSR